MMNRRSTLRLTLFLLAAIFVVGSGAYVAYEFPLRLRTVRQISHPEPPKPPQTTRNTAPARLSLSAPIDGDERVYLTLLHNENELVPIIERPRSILAVALTDDDPEAQKRFLEELVKRVEEAQLSVHAYGPHAEGAADLTVQADSADLAIVTTYAKALTETQRSLLRHLTESATPIILISFGYPQAISDLQQPSVYIVAGDSDPDTQSAAVQALFGERGFHGTLSTETLALYGYGAGIQQEQVALRYGNPSEAGMDADRLAAVDSLIYASIEAHAFPGAAVAIGRNGVLAKLQGYGRFTYESMHPVVPSSLFDIASLTKVIATTTAVMKLYEDGRINLDAPVAYYLPAFALNGKEKVTIRQLLSHSSGLPAFRPFQTMGLKTRDEVVDAIMSEKLQYKPGTDTRYSDLGMIAIALVVEGITGKNFADYTRETIFEPLGMRSTGFRPVGAGSDSLIVPTEIDNLFRKRLIQGEVHDETAYLLGGIAGNAGIFSTAEDISRFAYMLLNEGRIYGKQFLKQETIQLFTTRITPSGTRALGWDTRNTKGFSSAGQFFGPHSFGHTGFTGASLWIDPEAELFVVLLTNRVYPTRENNRIGPVRSKLADIAYKAMIPTLEPVLPIHAGR